MADPTRDAIEQALVTLVQEQGQWIARDPVRVRTLLQHSFANSPIAQSRELEATVSAVEYGVFDVVSSATDASQVDALVGQLDTQRGLTDDESRWAVQSWARAASLPLPAGWAGPGGATGGVGTGTVAIEPPGGQGGVAYPAAAAGAVAGAAAEAYPTAQQPYQPPPQPQPASYPPPQPAQPAYPTPAGQQPPYPGYGQPSPTPPPTAPGYGAGGYAAGPPGAPPGGPPGGPPPGASGGSGSKVALIVGICVLALLLLGGAIAFIVSRGGQEVVTPASTAAPSTKKSTTTTEEDQESSTTKRSSTTRRSTTTSEEETTTTAAPTTTEPPLEWTTFNDPAGKFNVDFPGPYKLEQTTTTIDGQTVGIFDYISKAKNVQYEFLVYELPPGYYFPNPQGSIENIITRLTSSDASNIIERDSASYAGNPALKLHVKKADSETLVLGTIAGNRVYVLYAVGAPDLTKGDFPRFLSGFHIK